MKHKHFNVGSTYLSDKNVKWECKEIDYDNETVEFVSEKELVSLVSIGKIYLTTKDLGIVNSQEFAYVGNGIEIVRAENEI